MCSRSPPNPPLTSILTHCSVKLYAGGKTATLRHGAARKIFANLRAHRPGQPVHQLRLHRAPAGGRHPHLDGRPGPVHWTTSSIERLWRSLKYEAVYLHEIADGPHRPARHRRLDRLLQHPTRPHSALGGQTPAEAYRDGPACGYDGQAATRLAHRSTGATAATGRSIQGDSGGLRNNRNTPLTTLSDFPGATSRG